MEGVKTVRKKRVVFFYIGLVILLCFAAFLGFQLWMQHQQKEAKTLVEKEEGLLSLHKEVLHQAQLNAQLVEALEGVNARVEASEAIARNLQKQLGSFSMDEVSLQNMQALEALRLAAYYSQHQRNKEKALVFLKKSLKQVQSDALKGRLQEAYDTLAKLERVDTVALWKKLDQWIDQLHNLSLKIPTFSKEKTAAPVGAQAPPLEWRDWKYWTVQAGKLGAELGSLVRIRDHQAMAEYSTLEDRAFSLKMASWVLAQGQAALVSGDSDFFKVIIARALEYLRPAALWEPSVKEMLEACQQLLTVSFDGSWPALEPFIQELEQLITVRFEQGHA